MNVDGQSEKFIEFPCHLPQTYPLYKGDTLGYGPDISPNTEDRKCAHTVLSLVHRTV